MSKERARRRAEREALLAAEKAKRARRSAWRQRRRAIIRAVKPRRRARRTGKMFARRAWWQRAVIALVAVGALALVWTYVDTLALRIGLTLLLVVALPVFVVTAFDRRV